MDGLLIFVVFFPAVAAATIGLIAPRDDRTLVRALALASTLAVFVLSIVLLIAFDRSPGDRHRRRSSSRRTRSGSIRTSRASTCASTWASTGSA